ncbi:MAG: radical SAM protein [Acidobacteria bacterium]|nr:radical SAM protein [Acidobacteriota bacterium]MYD72507.1 radical SAM protein [Acidobacteriota bacterium]MYJ05015.1 radical SAM protein [Acidobacteriota bacterium]
MLTVNEIFYSIQGESSFSGRPCVFVRLTACDLRCRWCDTAYAFAEGEPASVDDVLERIGAYDCPLVEITGGEPLLQSEVYPLMRRLLDRGKTVLLETGGHIDISAVPREVVKVVDVKCPGSGESERNDWGNLERLATHDEVKFVIADRADYEFARDVVREHGLDRRCRAVLLSPVHGELDPSVLSAWVLEDRVPGRVQVQLHKYLWGAETRGV